MGVQYVKVDGRWSAVSGDEPVEPVESGAEVDALPFVDEGGAQVEQLDEGEVLADAVDEDPDVFGHED